MDDLQPYTSPDEDPFHALPPPAAVFALRRRPTSLIDKWIREQREELDEDDDDDEARDLTTPLREAERAGTLVYPDQGKAIEADVSSVYSYDWVDDDDLPRARVAAPRAVLRRRRSRAGSVEGHKTSKLRLRASFRKLNRSFRPTSYPSGHPSASDDPSPRTSSRLSLFARPSNITRSDHASSLTAMPSNPSHSKWRPSIMGHFSHSSQSSIPQDPPSTPSRPSLSSRDTSMSSTSATRTASTVDSDMPPTPSRPSFLESIRSKNRSSLSIFKTQMGSSSSICSPSRAHFDDIHEAGPSSADGSQRALSPTDSTLPRRMSPYASRGHYDNLLDDDEDFDEHYTPPPPLPVHYKRESARSSLSFSSPGSTFSRVNLGSLGSRAQKKRKRLVISGVGVHETRKFEGVKEWCENFGEIKQITRVANGDLHIDFRLPEVADTVCRIRAKVFIAGVGSVYLSWITGDKR